MEMKHKRHNMISLGGCRTPLVLSDAHVPRKEQRESAGSISRMQSNYPRHRFFRNAFNKKQTNQNKPNQTPVLG